jgi:hypothetical protein
MQTILHIGMPKTGSTVLQDRLRISNPALAAKGVLYPSNPPGCPFNNHRLLLFGFTPYEKLPRHVRKVAAYRPETLATDYAAFRDHLANQVTATRPERLVLSSESLFRTLRARGRAALTEAVAPYGPTTVAVYLRRPSSYYLSALQQHLKSSQRVLPPRVPATIVVLRDYRAAFGAEAIRPRIYDRSLLAEGDIVEDFLATHLPETGLTATDLAPVARSNETLSAEAMDLLRAFRAAFHGASDNVPANDSSQLVKALAQIDAKLGAPRPELRPEIADAVDYANRDALAIRDRWGLVFPGLDYDRLKRMLLPDHGLPAILRDRLRPWRLEEIVPIDRELQQAILDRLARSRWGLVPSRALWIKGLRRSGVAA